MFSTEAMYETYIWWRELTNHVALIIGHEQYCSMRLESGADAPWWRCRLDQHLLLKASIQQLLVTAGPDGYSDCRTHRASSNVICLWQSWQMRWFHHFDSAQSVLAFQQIQSVCKKDNYIYRISKLYCNSFKAETLSVRL